MSEEPRPCGHVVESFVTGPNLEPKTQPAGKRVLYTDDCPFCHWPETPPLYRKMTFRERVAYAIGLAWAKS